MPAIQAMRSDALALRAKEDVQEKIPSFFNSVNKSLGQNIVQGQDSAQAVAEARFSAANQLAATLRQKLDGEGSLSELVAGAGMDLINSSVSLLLSLLNKTTTQDLLDTASAISAFLSEREALQLQWDAAAATYAQWTVQAGYTGRGDFFPATTTTPGNQTVQQTVTQWMRATGPATLPVTADGTPDLSGLNFVGNRLDQPPGISLYEYTDTNEAGATKQRNITVNFDRSGDNRFGAVNATGDEHEGTSTPGGVPQGDVSSQLFKETGANVYWLRYDYTIEVTKTSTAGTANVRTVSVSNIGSGVDYDIGYGLINGTLAPNGSDTGDFDRDRSYGATLSSNRPAGATTISVPNGTGYYRGDVIEIVLASGASDYRTITNVSGNTFTLDAPLSGNANSGAAVTVISYPNPANYDGVTYTDDRGTPDTADDIIKTNPDPDAYPDTPRYYRADNISYGGVLGTIDVPPVRPVFEKSALGGRGATTYRDALTPRWTDRNYYVGVNGATRDYEAYYAWGSVGSISRVGRY